MKVLTVVALIASSLVASGCLITRGDGAQFECGVYLDDPLHAVHCVPVGPAGSIFGGKP